MGFNAFGPRNERYEAAMVEFGRVTEWIKACCKRENLAPGGIGEALYNIADSGEITHDEAGMLVRSLLAAGLDTTIHTIGNALSCLSRFPDEWTKVRRDPALIRNVIEEVVRFESPVQTFFRTTTCTVKIGETEIPEGEKVLAFLASANRDPRRWERPDVFDVTRRSVGHLAFGHGIHRCVGEMLAKTETEILLTKLAERVSSIVPAGQAKLRLNNTLRGFERLPLRLSA
jgi:4-methoxybenzoate monooxygenase (O-demethylating)